MKTKYYFWAVVAVILATLILVGIASAKGFPPKFFMEGVPVSGSGDCYADMAPGDTYKIPDDYCTYWTGVNFSLILTEEDDDEVIDIPVVKIIPTVKPPTRSTPIPDSIVVEKPTATIVPEPTKKPTATATEESSCTSKNKNDDKKGGENPCDGNAGGGNG